jgi:dTDP-glucose 4,6-dehydratase
MNTLQLKDSSILVTGASGFIGSHLVESLLNKSAHVRAFVRYTSSGSVGNLNFLRPFPENLEVVYGDLKNSDAVRKAMVDINYVFNLASVVSIPYSYVNPREFFDNNIYFILNILEAARYLKTHGIIHISTSEVYGSAEKVPISEKHPLKGQSPYSASKIGADMVAMSYYLSFDSPVCVIRPFNTFGPRQSERAVIPTIINQALNQNAILLGDVRPTRDFNYISDTIEGIIAAGKHIDQIHGEVINLGSGVEVTIKEIADQIVELIGSKAKIVFDATKVRPSKSEVQRLCADASKAYNLLKWENKVSLPEGLRLTIKWFEEFHSSKSEIKSYL